MVLSVPTLRSVKTAVAVGDYAASTGTTGSDVDLVIPHGPTIPHNGAFRAVDGLKFVEFNDGLTNTLLLGEKNVPRSTWGFPPNDCGIYDGHHPVCSQRAAGPNFPLAGSDLDTGWKFGSPHPGICQFAFADGAVRPVANSINPYVFGLLAQRNDGQPVSPD